VLGREPTDDEVAEKLGWATVRVKAVKSVAREPISLETPIGEEEDRLLGDFFEDKDVESPSIMTAFRLLQEPTRLARRYASTNTEFVYLVAQEWRARRRRTGSSGERAR
jgi:DNA-directed RNA polymerase sigma subunit (sigma70/sigma32)